MSITLLDVARRARVSASTASRVVSGSSYPVAGATRARVEQAVQDLKYTPNALGRALATRQSRTIGLIVGDIQDPYFAEIARGMEDFTRRHGYLTIVCNADRSAARELAYLRLLGDEHGASGIVFAGGSFLESEETGALRAQAVGVRERGTRVIGLVERPIDEHMSVIGVDNHAVAYDITSYLASLGHKRIAFVDGPRGFTTADLRRDGFVHAIRDAELGEPVLYPGGFDDNAGRTSALRILGQGLPDAIVTFNDISAVGLVMALRQAGVDVPGDVSVAGIDGTRDALLVDLTTVTVPMYELGAAAARAVIESDPPPSRIVMPHRVMPRSTTRRRS
jgi:LacI family transcriptional regulator